MGDCSSGLPSRSPRDPWQESRAAVVLEKWIGAPERAARLQTAKKVFIELILQELADLILVDSLLGERVAVPHGDISGFQRSRVDGEAEWRAASSMRA